MPDGGIAVPGAPLGNLGDGGIAVPGAPLGSLGDGEITLLGGPLGDLLDASERFRSTLAGADLVAVVEPGRLAQLALVTPAGPVVRYADDAVPELVAAARAGQRVVLVTDGRPDQGRRLVDAAHRAGLPVTVVPGPSAVVAALAISGLPSDRFCVEGFLPRRVAARQSRLTELAPEPRTLVFFEAPPRVAGALRDLAQAFGPDRAAAWCASGGPEPQVRRGPLGALAADPPEVEVTLVVAGSP